MIGRLLLGPQTLSWQTLAFLAPVGILAGLASTSDADLTTRVTWLGAACIAQVALTLVYAAGAALGLGRWRAAVLVTVILGAAARAASLVALTSAFGDVDPLTSTERMIGATVTFTLWGIALGAAVQGWSQHRSALRAMAADADRALADAQELSQVWQQRLDATTPSPASVALTAEGLHAAVDAQLRPLSHRLWFTLTDREARHHFARSLLSETPPVWWISVLTAIALVWNTQFVYGLTRSLIAAALGVTCLVLILRAGRRLADHTLRASAGIALASLLLAGIACGVVASLVIGITDIGVVIIVVTGTIGIILGVQIIAVSSRLRFASISDLQQRTQALDAERAEVATYLHSTVQARWTAAAHRLEEAAESGDMDAARRALVSARALLEHDGPPERETQDLAGLALAWEGIATVHLEVDPRLPERVHAVVGRIVDEAISNAVRHGRARNIDVTITMAEQAADVIVTDDGTGIAETERRGLGSDWLDTVAQWSLTRTDTGARLTASVAV